MSELSTITGQTANFTETVDTKKTRILIAGSILAAVIYQIVLLVLIGLQNRYKLNPDAVCYVRIASYYAEGQFDLAVSGYWGPMLSWLIAPLLNWFENPLDTARLVMGVSAFIFLLGSIALFRSMETPVVGLILGTWIVAVSTVAWSVAAITPDLLVSGLMCIAISKMFSTQWLESRTTQVTAGLLWGAAYLTKAVAFPLAILVGSAISVLWMIGRSPDRRTVWHSLAVTLITFFLVASPWIITLSYKYKSFVFSNSGRAAHAIVGPQAVDRNHPTFRHFHLPESGRITSAEDSYKMPYTYWSPLESAAYAKHQIRLIYTNLASTLNHFSNVDWFHAGLFATVVGLLVHQPWQQNMRVDRWRWTGIILGCLASIYLPVYALDWRYYYLAYPLLLAASFGFVASLTYENHEGLSLPQIIGFLLIAISFGLPARSSLYGTNIITPTENQGPQAYDLAQKLKMTGLQGSIAGGAPDGLYLAFFTNQPWHGAELNPTAESFKNSQAKLALVHRDQPIVYELDHDTTFVNLDSLLFSTKGEANAFPWKIYQIDQH